MVFIIIRKDNPQSLPERVQQYAAPFSSWWSGLKRLRGLPLNYHSVVYCFLHGDILAMCCKVISSFVILFYESADVVLKGVVNFYVLLCSRGQARRKGGLGVTVPHKINRKIFRVRVECVFVVTFSKFSSYHVMLILLCRFWFGDWRIIK